MKDAVMAVEGLGKAFVRYQRERHRFMNWLGLTRKPEQEFWAVRDVSFSLASGEALGIVGQNGAGKSTLLKLITGTLRPTCGAVHLNGSVSAILELGMGFHPEMTGRQNVFHSAGLMGFQLGQIKSMLPAIEDFAEIGNFFDQPVRTYSSGMQVRLAFAVVTAVRPELLIIDEALAVGDAYFQHKSFDRIKSFRSQGTSLLIVSHEKSSVQILCDRAILMHKGRVAMDGQPEMVLDYYNALMADEENRSIEMMSGEQGRVAVRSGTGQAVIKKIELQDADGNSLQVARVGQQLSLQITVMVREHTPRLVLGYMIKNHLGQAMFGTNTSFTGQVMEDLCSGTQVSYLISFKAALGPGSYSVAVNLADSENHLAVNYEWQDLALIFSVVNHGLHEFMGLVWMPPMISISRSTEAAA